MVNDSANMWMSLKGSPEISGLKVDPAGNGQAVPGKLDSIEPIFEARKLPRFTLILALMTESQQGKRDEAKKNGATGWLVNPVGGADLVKVIKQVLPGGMTPA